MSRTAANMKKLIEKQYYSTAEEAYEKLDAFLMANRITMEEYTDLCVLVEEVYAEPEADPVEEVPTEAPTEETPNDTADEAVSE